MSDDHQQTEDVKGNEMDLKIRAIETKKHDIPQCHAAKHRVVPKHPFRMLLTGCSGSGKSTLLINLLKRFYIRKEGKSYFDEIYAIGPTVKFDDMYKSLNLPEKFLIENPTPEFLGRIYEDQKSEVTSKGSHKAKRILFIFEDIISHAKFMRSKAFLKAYVMGRHYGISLMVCSQSYTKVPRACRLQCTQIVFFPSKFSETMLMYEEYCPPNTNKKDFLELIQYATTPMADDDFPFLFIDATARTKDKFRKNLNERLFINTCGSGGETGRRHKKMKHNNES